MASIDPSSSRSLDVATPRELAAPTRVRQSPVRTAFAGLIGNVLEWFDFAVYGVFASEIGKQFFPDSDPTAQKLKAFLVFAIGFIGRPIGSLVLGPLGDRIGRRALLTLSVAVMGVATLLVGLLPTYASIGVAAPILLVTLRFIQGFSLGGEFTGSMVYTTELASPRLRGLISSATAAGTTTGFLLGSLTGWLIAIALDKPAIVDWGWRLPFIGSVVFCIAGWLLRRGIAETAEGTKAAAERPPLLSIFRDWRPMLQTFGIIAMSNAAYYLAITFAQDRRKAESPTFQLVNTLSLFGVLLCKPIGGWLSDRFGRRRVMIVVTIVAIALVYPGLHLILVGTPLEFMAGQLLLAAPAGLALGLQGAMVVEIFPLRTRVTSMSLAYSVSLCLSGAIAPFVSIWLIDTQHSVAMLVGYIVTYGAIGLVVMGLMRETNNRALDQ